MDEQEDGEAVERRGQQAPDDDFHVRDLGDVDHDEDGDPRDRRYDLTAGRRSGFDRHERVRSELEGVPGLTLVQ